MNMTGFGAHIEAERRFVVSTTCNAGKVPELLPADACQLGLIVQGYLIASEDVEFRVRSGVEDFFTLKTARGHGRRLELEVPLPGWLTRTLVRFCRWKIEKTRWTYTNGGQRWEIDVYHGVLAGLITAEAETMDFDSLDVPSWAGREVTGTPSWSNRSLARVGLPKE